jgi:hypothetical protein
MKMVEDAWSRWWRMWSTRWDAIEYALLAYFLANPAEVPKLIGMLPNSTQDFAAFLIPILLFSAKTGTKMVAQKSLSSQDTP